MAWGTCMQDGWLCMGWMLTAQLFSPEIVRQGGYGRWAGALLCCTVRAVCVALRARVLGGLGYSSGL